MSKCRKKRFVTLSLILGEQKIRLEVEHRYLVDLYQEDENFVISIDGGGLVDIIKGLEKIQRISYNVIRSEIGRNTICLHGVPKNIHVGFYTTIC